MTEPVVQAEQTFVENQFGTVTSKRVIYYRSKGWFSGGSREDIPILLWGSPSVVVNTAGRDLNAAKGFPWQRGEANAFVEALRQQLFKP